MILIRSFIHPVSPNHTPILTTTIKAKQNEKNTHTQASKNTISKDCTHEHTFYAVLNAGLEVRVHELRRGRVVVDEVHIDVLARFESRQVVHENKRSFGSAGHMLQ